MGQKVVKGGFGVSVSVGLGQGGKVKNRKTLMGTTSITSGLKLQKGNFARGLCSVWFLAGVGWNVPRVRGNLTSYQRDGKGGQKWLDKFGPRMVVPQGQNGI